MKYIIPKISGKKGSIKLWQWSLLIIGLLFIAYTFFLVLLPFSSPYAQAHNRQITAQINSIFPYPIAIAEVKVRSRALLPVLQLQDITIFNAEKSRVLWHVNELSIGIRLWRSLWYWHLEVGGIRISGVTLVIKTGADGDTKIGNVVVAHAASSPPLPLLSSPSLLSLQTPSSPSPEQQSSNFFLHLDKVFNLQRISFDDITLIWERPGKPTLNFSQISFRLINDLSQHKMVISGQVLQDKPRVASFTISANFNNTLWHLHKSRVVVEIKADNLNLHVSPEIVAFLALIKNSDNADGSDSRGNDFVRRSKLLLQSGEIALQLRNTNLEAEQWFTVPLPLSYLGGNINWQNAADGLKVKISDVQLDLATLDMQGGGDLSWLASPSSSNNSKKIFTAPDADLQFDIAATDLGRLTSYFPVKIMHPGLVDWLQHAFTVQGSVDGEFVLQGNLSRFPFANNGNQNNQSNQNNSSKPNGQNGKDNPNNLSDQSSQNNSAEVFKIDLDLHGVDLLYHREWPQFKDLNGRALFTGKGMDIALRSSKVADIPIYNCKTVIADWREPILFVTGEGRAQAALMQRFVNLSPLRDTVGKYLEHMVLSDLLAVDLKVTVPLSSSKEKNALALVSGDISLQDNGLLMPLWNLQLQNIKGHIKFADDVITAPNLHAALLGQPVTLHINTFDERHGTVISCDNADNNREISKVTQISFASAQPLALLQKQFPVLAVSPYAQGNFAYQGTLKLPRRDSKSKNIELDISSELNGVKIDFPPLLTKSAEVVNNFKLHFTFVDDLMRSRALLQYGDKISAALAFAKNKGNMELTSGMLRFGSTTLASVPKTPGLMVIGKLGKVNWNEWQQYIFPQESKNIGKTEDKDKNKEQSKTKNKEIVVATAPSPSSSLPPSFPLRLISKIKLDIDQFYGWGQTLTPLHINVEQYGADGIQATPLLPPQSQSRSQPQLKPQIQIQQKAQPVQISRANKTQGGGWLISLHNQLIEGQLAIPFALQHGGTLVARMQRLYLLAAGVQKKSTINPQGLPLLDVVINDLRYGNRLFGRVVFRASPIVNGLQIEQLKINAAVFQIDAVGKWQRAANNSVRSEVQGKYLSNNVGVALKQLGFTSNLANGTGAANFVLSWQDAFFAPDVASMDGSVAFDVRRGRIINLEEKTEAELGIGRLLSVISLQTLPRRLTLDFSDLVKSGFSFDVLKGSLKLIAGDAFTDDAELNGPVAQVKVRGRIGFGKKDYDINLTVIPRITSSLPVIATVAGGPVLGAATWLADKVIGSQVSRVASYVYKIKGSWLKPDIKKM